MQKPTVYAEVPDFDQTTQYVVELPPEEKEDCIFVGIEVKEMVQDDTPMEEHIPEQVEIPEYVPPLTLEERVTNVESDVDDVVAILATIEGVSV